MYELIQLTDKCYYIQCPAKIGLIKTGENEVCLIDSGNDKDAGKKVKRILDEKGWTLRAIYNTHSHSDHIGGNNYLQKQTGCKVFAKGVERAFTLDPILEPSLLYGGFPFKDLKHKFLLAERSEAELLTEEALPEGMEMVSLPGHFFDMVGFKYDNVLYLADCLSNKETIDKYKIGFLYDVKEYIKTLEMVMEMKAEIFVPSHAEVCNDISELAQYNIDKVNMVIEKILSVCEKPLSFEEILQKLFYDYELTMTYEQYVLVGSSVKSYLSYLKEEGRLETRIENNRLLWQKKI